MTIQPISVQSLIALAGGPTALGRRLGCARTTVLDWRKANTIPGSRLAQISIEMGIPPGELLHLAQLPRRPPVVPRRRSSCAA
jgi:hypothetical protein